MDLVVDARDESSLNLSPIAVVTLSMDNPHELVETLASVDLQTRRPELALVVDSSSKELRPQMAAIATKAGADYVWIKAEGIYSAMRSSLDFVPPSSYVLWLNSSDRFASPYSLELLHRTVIEKGGPVWVVGTLVRSAAGRLGLHKNGTSPKGFVRGMAYGWRGFPHPATLFKLDDLLGLDPYNSALIVAEDYRLALLMAKKYGPPELVRIPISIHRPDGFTMRHPILGFRERVQARIEIGGPLVLIGQLVVVPFTLLQGVIRRSLGWVGAPLDKKSKGFIAKRSAHFCAYGDERTWPLCCDEHLNRDSL